MTDRYFIDERVGCIAVRDREQTDMEDRELHAATFGVVKLWRAEYTREPCPTCGHVVESFKVSPESRTQAILLCAELNAKKGET